jgi:hypothetical protein
MDFHKDKCAKDGRYTICKECKSQYVIAKYWKNPEANRLKRKQRYLDNVKQERETAKLNSRKWRKQNPGHRNALKAKYKADKALRTPKWLTETDLNEIKEFYTMAKTLETIFPWKQHVDHILPLRGKLVSGFHCPNNLQILSEKMNIEKHNTYEVA